MAQTEVEALREVVGEIREHVKKLSDAVTTHEVLMKEMGIGKDQTKGRGRDRSWWKVRDGVKLN